MASVRSERSNPGRMSAEDRRNQIVEIAAELFSQKGFRGTTTKEIAERAGVSEAIIFRHFATKDDLYAAILSSRLRRHDLATGGGTHDLQRHRRTQAF